MKSLLFTAAVALSVLLVVVSLFLLHVVLRSLVVVAVVLIWAVLLYVSLKDTFKRGKSNAKSG